MTAPFPWKLALAAMPPGMTFSEVSRRLCQSYQTTRMAIRKHRYKAVDGRKFSQNRKRKLQVSDLDPRKSTVEIARACGVTKQRVSALAKQLGVKLKDTRGRKPYP